MWGELPSWGFYLRHAQGISMKNITMSFREDDFRPAIVMDDVSSSTISDVRIPSVKEMPMFHLNNSKDVKLLQLKIPVAEEKAVLKTNYN